MTSLAAKRVVVTRAAHQAEELAGPLRDAGAEVILLPTISIVPPGDPEPLERAVHQLNSYSWIVFTSSNAVDAVAERLEASKPAPRARIAAIGNATKRAVEKLGWRVDLVPKEFVAEELAAALPVRQGECVLMPSAAVRRDVLPKLLALRGAHVDVVEAYRNVMPPEAAAHAHELFSHTPKPDWITFTSSSSIDNLISVTGPSALLGVKIASIGPITSATVRAHGLEITAEPREHSINGMLRAIFQSK